MLILNKSLAFKVLKALHTINKKAKKHRDVLFSLDPWDNNPLNQYNIFQSKQAKKNMYSLKNRAIKKLIKNNILAYKNTHILKRSDRDNGSYLLADCYQNKFSNYSFHHNLRWDFVYEDDNFEKIDEISSKTNKEIFSDYYAIKILKDYLNN